MKLEYIEGDLFESDAALLIHGCNAQKVFGSGVALEMKNRYPLCFRAYSQFSAANNLVEGFNCKYGDSSYGHNYIYTDYESLGRVCFWVNPHKGHRYIANAITQMTYGRNGGRYTSYEAVYSCLEKIRDFCLYKLNEQGDNSFITKGVALPYKFTCDRGGAEWSIVEAMIKFLFENTEVRVRIYKLNK